MAIVLVSFLRFRHLFVAILAIGVMDLLATSPLLRFELNPPQSPVLVRPHQRPLVLPRIGDRLARDHPGGGGVLARTPRHVATARVRGGGRVRGARRARPCDPGRHVRVRGRVLGRARALGRGVRLRVACAGRRVPRVLPAWWERRAPRAHRGADGGDHTRPARPAGSFRHEHRTVRGRGLGRLHPPADEPRRRVAGVRQDLGYEPRPRRSLVPDDAHDHVRPARGRDLVLVGAPADRTGGLRPAAARRPGVRGRAHLRDRRAHAEPGVPARRAVLRRRRHPRSRHGRRRDRRPGDAARPAPVGRGAWRIAT